jgi:hyaluronate lyase
MKSFICKILITVMFLMTAAIPNPYGSLSSQASANAVTLDEFDVLRNKFAGDTSYDVNDPDIATKLARISNTGQLHWDTLIKDPARTYLWNDLNNPIRSHHMASSYSRVEAMAVAYSTVGSTLYGNNMLRDDIVSAMDWLHDNRYNDTLSSGWETVDNSWYHWEIGAPQSITAVVMLMYDEFTNTQITNYMNAVYKFSSDPNIRLMTGANLMWKTQIIAYHGIIVKSEELLEVARDRVSLILPYSESGDGFYRDGSFIQHIKHPYNGGYGKSLLGEIAVIVDLLHGSRWEVTDLNLSHLYEWVYQSFEPLIYKGAMMDMVRGREISRYAFQDHAVGHLTMAAILRISQFAPPADAARMKSMLKYWIQADTFRNFYASGPIDNTILAKEIMADQSIVPRGELIEHKQFSNMDRAVHLRPGFGIGLSMSSNRIYNYESISNVNMKAWYTADGMTYLYNNDLSQYSEEFWSTVNPYRMPGTTVDTLARTVTGIPYQKEYLSPNTWVGGSVFDGLYGAVGMDLKASGDLNANGDVITSSSLTAKKSWFMFDDEVVALGAGITSTDNRAIETIVENRKLNAIGDNALTVNGTVKSDALGWSETMTGVNWAHLGGSVPGSDVGYYFPDSPTIKSLREARSGRWGDISTSSLPSPDPLLTRNYLSLWFDHGHNPDDATYAYVLLPNRNEAGTESYSQNPTIQILQNTSEIQAVTETSLGLTGINFWESGMYEDVWSYNPSSVMMKDAAGELTFAVSDPTHTSDKLVFEIDKVGTSVISADPSVTVLRTTPNIKVEVNTADSRGGTHSFKLAYDTAAPAPGFGGPELGQVHLTADKSVVLVGDSAALDVSASLEDGQPLDLSNAVVEFSSDNPTLATVDQSGNVTALNGGTVHLTATVTHAAVTRAATITIRIPYGQAIVVDLHPVEDAFVRSGAYAETNYGNSTRLEVNGGGGDFHRRSYLKYDLSPIIGEIFSSQLYVYGSGNPKENKLFSVENDNWTETAVNWNNKPAQVDYLASAFTDTAAAYHELDITDYIFGQDAGDQIASLAIMQDGTGQYTSFNSRESANNKPYLRVSSYLFEPEDFDVSVDLDSQESVLIVGENAVLEVRAELETGAPVDLSQADIAYSSDDPSIAAIDQTGQITAFAAGSVHLTASVTLGGVTKSATIAIRVYYEEIVTDLLPIEDAHVRSGTFAADNYGSQVLLELNNAGGNFNRQTFLKFDLSEIEGEMDSAKLYLYGAITDADQTRNSRLFRVADDGWSESSLYWNNKPALGTLLLSAMMDNQAMYREFDITDYVKAEATGDQIATLAVLNDGAGAFATLNSKENAANKPYLRIRSYRSEPIAGPSASGSNDMEG